ncbi:hypothetical protein, partial [Treponema paraluiscuniculi]|uniref:hypothetical protein n=1 Tax=Treponema paraluiscuniculi TaxID=53435 RepID=UPI002FDBC3AE
EPVLQSGGAGSSFGGKAGASHASAAAGVSAGAAFQGGDCVRAGSAWGFSSGVEIFFGRALYCAGRA